MTALSNLMHSSLLSYQSLTGEDVACDAGRMRVTATLKLHPQAKLEQMASRISMEKSVSRVSWLAREAPPAPE
jgi:putative Mg2+ transporter-C (MgtC) family protein